MMRARDGAFLAGIAIGAVLGGSLTGYVILLVLQAAR